MNVIPLPNKYQVYDGYFYINNNSKINFSHDLKKAADYFLNYIKKETELSLIKDNFASILFTLDFSLDEEGYKIIITPNSLELTARTAKGAFYGVQTLIQLMVRENQSFKCACTEISDSPRFTYRGFMFDVARHFFPKSIIFKLIDYISFHKFNVLHLHLTDDQGWRIEIEKYPLLTKVGSVRKHTFLGTKFKDNRIHQGYYTKPDLMEIVKYANEHFVEIIPEIDIPGHTNSLIAAYPEMSCTKEKIEVRTTYGISKIILCAGKMKVYQMIEDILNEVIDIFKPRFIHLGGDEAPKTQWKNCESCNKVLKENHLKNYHELQAYFFNHFTGFLREKGITVIGWNECINNSLSSNVIIQHWKPFTQKKTVKTINAGRKTIISNFSHLYMDYPYSLTPLEKTYKFNPVLNGVTNKDYIIGLEAPLWTEWVDNISKLEYQIFPRISAISEIAWTNEENRNYESFIYRLKKFYPLFQKDNINYAKNKEKKLSFIKGFRNTINWLKNKDSEYDQN